MPPSSYRILLGFTKQQARAWAHEHGLLQDARGFIHVQEQIRYVQIADEQDMFRIRGLALSSDDDVIVGTGATPEMISEARATVRLQQQQA